MGRRIVLGALALIAPMLAPSFSAADGDADAVPAEIQAELLSKLVVYDRNFTARAGDTVRVLLLVKPDRPRSRVSAADMKSALGHIDRIGGLPHEETIAPFAGAEALAVRCRNEHIAAVYLTPGFDDDLEQLRESLANVSVLSVGAVSDQVPRGIVLGFELEAGKTRILVNLKQARRQNVDFSSDVLRLVKVYQ